MNLAPIWGIVSNPKQRVQQRIAIAAVGDSAQLCEPVDGDGCGLMSTRRILRVDWL